jgi:hypothetical protein
MVEKFGRSGKDVHQIGGIHSTRPKTELAFMGISIDSGSKAVYKLFALAVRMLILAVYFRRYCECGSGYHALFKTHLSVVS